MTHTHAIRVLDYELECVTTFGTIPVAHWGRYEAEGATREEAVENLVRILESAFKRGGVPVYLEKIRVTTQAL